MPRRRRYRRGPARCPYRRTARAARDTFAFGRSGDEIEAWRQHLEGKGVAIEADFMWPAKDEAMRGRSIYFRDPAGNSIEIAEPRIWGIGTTP